MPRMLAMFAEASSMFLETFTPPPLPRPPACICALITTPFAPALSRRLAASSASSRVAAISPRGIATPYLARIAFAWYSWIFILFAGDSDGESSGGAWNGKFYKTQADWAIVAGSLAAGKNKRSPKAAFLSDIDLFSDCSCLCLFVHFVRAALVRAAVV